MTDELVFVETQRLNEIPFTTSKVIAEMTGIEHRKIKSAIRKYQKDMEGFGVLASYRAETQGNKEGGRKAVGYKLNEEQAFFLMTLLKNTPVVVQFKKELVRQFYAMKSELTKRAIAREARKPTRRELTDVIRDCVPDSPHKNRVYKNYTDLAYVSALGKTAAQLRVERDAPSQANLTEYLSVEEIEAIRKAEGKISVLIESGLSYPEIKSILLRNAAAKK